MDRNIKEYLNLKQANKIPTVKSRDFWFFGGGRYRISDSLSLAG